MNYKQHNISHTRTHTTHLLQDRVSGQLLQVLQVRMEEVCVCQGDLQQRLDDVADGAVVWEADLLCRADEIP